MASRSPSPSRPGTPVRERGPPPLPGSPARSASPLRGSPFGYEAQNSARKVAGEQCASLLDSVAPADVAADSSALDSTLKHEVTLSSAGLDVRSELEQTATVLKYSKLTRSHSDGQDIRWYFCKSSLRPDEAAAQVPASEIVGKGDYFRFSDGDSLALEASFVKREEELVSAWWKEYAEVSAGPTKSTSALPYKLQTDKELAEEKLRSPSCANDGGPFQQGPGSSHSEYDDDEESVGVLVKGGLYEVDLMRRRCIPVYWRGEHRRVLRGHWYALKAADWLPLREDVAEQLEIAYHKKVWRRRTFQPSGLYAARVNLTGTTVGLHALFTGEDASWEASLAVDASGISAMLGIQGSAVKLRRGFAPPTHLTQDEVRQRKEEELDDYASKVPVRHVVFMVHGIGQRLEKANLVDDVGTFRQTVTALSEHHLTPHQRNAQRILFIPCQWRRELKLGGEVAMEQVTLDGVRALRTMITATVHDVLYYMSPIYCQDIIDSVTRSLNRLYARFIKRNPSFDGKVSLYGHSLGSVLTYDILCHQDTLQSPFPVQSINAAIIRNDEREDDMPKIDRLPSVMEHEFEGDTSVEDMSSSASTIVESSVTNPTGISSNEIIPEVEAAEAEDARENENLAENIEGIAISDEGNENTLQNDSTNNEHAEVSKEEDTAQKLTGPSEEDAVSKVYTEVPTELSEEVEVPEKHLEVPKEDAVPQEQIEVPMETVVAQEQIEVPQKDICVPERIEVPKAIDVEQEPKEVPKEIDVAQEQTEVPKQNVVAQEQPEAPKEDANPKEQTEVSKGIGVAQEQTEVPEENVVAQEWTEAPKEIDVAQEQTVVPKEDGIPKEQTEVPKEIDVAQEQTEVPKEDGIPKEQTEVPKEIDVAQAQTEVSKENVVAKEHTDFLKENVVAQEYTEVRKQDAVPKEQTEVLKGNDFAQEHREVSKENDVTQEQTGVSKEDADLKEHAEVPKENVVAQVQTEAPKKNIVSHDQTEVPKENEVAQEHAQLPKERDITQVTKKDNGAEDHTEVSEEIEASLEHIEISKGDDAALAPSEGVEVLDVHDAEDEDDDVEKDIKDAEGGLLHHLESANSEKDVPEASVSANLQGAEQDALQDLAAAEIERALDLVDKVVMNSAEDCEEPSEIDRLKAEVAALHEKLRLMENKGQGNKPAPENSETREALNHTVSFNEENSEDSPSSAESGRIRGKDVQDLGQSSQDDAAGSMRGNSEASVSARKQHRPFIIYPKLKFKVETFYAVGSPLGMFLALRNIRIGQGAGTEYWQDEGINEEMPACRLLLNIFHPYDPVAYRLEPLICKEYVDRKPVFIPYHKGGKRIHIGLQEFGEDISMKSKAFVSSIGAVGTRVAHVFTSKKDDSLAEEEERERNRKNFKTYGQMVMERLTGRPEGRIDCMLQDATFEHQYISAISSHTSYWQDPDTALFILKHLYRDIPEGPEPDNVPTMEPLHGTIDDDMDDDEKVKPDNITTTSTESYKSTVASAQVDWDSDEESPSIWDKDDFVAALSEPKA